MTAKTIAIVSHCFCPPGLDIYAQHLRHQWASLVRYPSFAEVRLYVCCVNPEMDRATWDILSSDIRRPNVSAKLIARTMPPEKLFRRAIGRNAIAKQTSWQADVYWFTDVDYLFGPGCLDAVARLVGPDDGLCQPAWVNISRSHELGQKVIDDARGVALPDIAFDMFVPRRQRVCIGGVQIIGGNTARRIGYCDGTKWVEPVDVSKGFRSCKCDRAFRRINKLSAVKLEIPHCYRLRHESAGRDYDLQGVKREKEVW